MKDMRFMVHGRPEGSAGELYDKMTNSRACNIMKDAITVVTENYDDCHGLIGAITTKGVDCVVVQFKKWRGEEVFIQKAVSIDQLDEVMADLDDMEVLDECLTFLAKFVKENNLNTEPNE